jgi:nitroreductase
MNETTKNMMERRSIRNYTQEQVPEKILYSIIEAAQYSPNAGNRQTTKIIVCTNKEINDTLGKIHRVLFRKYNASKSGESVSLEDGDLEQQGLEGAFHQAPAAITLFGPKNFWFTEADCYIMANNICLAAYAYGVGSCIIGGVLDIFQNDYGNKLLKDWKVPENFRSCLHITLGYPAEGFPEPKPRTYPEAIVVW